jgi:MoxR-like ATPase
MDHSELAARVLAQVRRAVVGKDEALGKVLLAVLAGGHILLEDIPGVGKTTLALAFSRAMALSCNRVQFTPDVMPSDITGFSLFHRETGRMEYQPGAVLCNLFLADELNRATSRTQSALLEAMEEGQVTVDGVSHPVPQPFLVIATQNPAGASGTQLLPDSQLDRFMIRLSLGYPSPEDEAEMVRRRQGRNPLDGVEQVLTPQGLMELRRAAGAVHLSDPVLDYIIRLVGATRTHPMVIQGASPRATLALAAMSKAAALVHGRDYVIPQDVILVFSDVIAHRLILSPRAQADGTCQPARQVLSQVPPPAIR